MSKALVCYIPFCHRDAMDIEMELRKLTLFAYESACSDVSIIIQYQPLSWEPLWSTLTNVNASTLVIPSMRCIGYRASEQVVILRQCKRRHIRVLSRLEQYDSADPMSEAYNLRLYQAAKRSRPIATEAWLHS
ncbi:MAG: hypothetical protein ACM3ZQ_04880 [Bacillota bacterium]